MQSCCTVFLQKWSLFTLAFSPIFETSNYTVMFLPLHNKLKLYLYQLLLQNSPTGNILRSARQTGIGHCGVAGGHRFGLRHILSLRLLRQGKRQENLLRWQYFSRKAVLSSNGTAVFPALSRNASQSNWFYPCAEQPSYGQQCGYQCVHKRCHTVFIGQQPFEVQVWRLETVPYLTTLWLLAVLQQDTQVPATTAEKTVLLRVLWT